MTRELTFAIAVVLFTVRLLTYGWPYTAGGVLHVFSLIAVSVFLGVALANMFRNRYKG